MGKFIESDTWYRYRIEVIAVMYPWIDACETSSKFMLELGNQRDKAFPDVFQDQIGVYDVKDYFVKEFLEIANRLGYEVKLIKTFARAKSRDYLFKS